MKLSVVIPVFNEKNTIADIIGHVKAVKDLDKEIIVVDDGSKDGTVKILKDLEKVHPDVKFYYKEKNVGKGDTLRIGFSHTTGDYVIVQDADLEYDPQDFKRLLRALTEKKADVVYGSRFSGTHKDMSVFQYFGNKLLTIMTNLLFGIMLTDMETCYKLIPGDFVRNLQIKSQRFDFEPEITARILKSGLKLKEVPVSYKGRKYSEGKKITWVDGFAALWTLFKFRFMDW